jgi:hypothetical protein
MDSKNACVIVVGRDGTEQTYSFDALLEGDSDGERALMNAGKNIAV